MVGNIFIMLRQQQQRYNSLWDDTGPKWSKIIIAILNTNSPLEKIAEEVVALENCVCVFPVAWESAAETPMFETSNSALQIEYNPFDLSDKTHCIQAEYFSAVSQSLKDWDFFTFGIIYICFLKNETIRLKQHRRKRKT